MSHEIRTPLVGILGMTELLRKSPLGSRQMELVTLLGQSGDSLLQILNDILDVSKIEAGKMVLLEEPFSLRETVDSALSLMAEPAFRKQLELVCDIDPAIPETLVGDAGRLRQILLNLLGNAIKFTEAGDVLLRLELRETTDALCWLEVEVRDTGIGMSPAEQAIVFDLFTQADGSTRRAFGGTGLGLSIVRQLLQLMGSDIQLDSAPGRGSSFRFPLCLPTAGTRLPLSRPMLSNRPRILVVEDHPLCRDMLCRHLTAAAGRVHSAATAAQGLEMLERATAAGEGFDVILLDATLPDLPAQQAVRSLRNHPALRQLRVILLETPGQGLEPNERVDGALIKPVDAGRLVNLCREILARPVEAPPQLPPQLPPQTELPAPRTDDMGLRVLAVEDKPTTRRLMELVLQSAGCQATLATNGQEALEHLATAGFDLILMDGHMPVMDGYEATRAIRQRGITTPIVALTADAREDTLRLCREAGMDDYLRKPFKLEQIQRLLERWLPTSPPV